MHTRSILFEENIKYGFKGPIFDDCVNIDAGKGFTIKYIIKCHLEVEL